MTNIADIRRQYPQYADVSDGDLLMGLHRKFYSDMHPRAFLNSIEGAENSHVTIKNPALKEYFREAVSRPMTGEGQRETNTRLGGQLTDRATPGNALVQTARSGLQGLTFGAGDEIVAGGTSLFSGRSYEDELARERSRLAQGREQRPIGSAIAEVGGALAAPATMLAGGGPLALRTAKAALVGAGEGAVYGFNAGEDGFENRARNAAETAAFAAPIAAAGPALGRAAKRIYDSASLRKAARRLAKSAPSLDELKAEAARIYAQADEVQNLPRGAFADDVRAAISGAQRKGLDADLTPGAAKVADRLSAAADAPDPNIGFREVDVLRRKAGVPAGNVQNRTEQAIGSGMVEAIDQYVDDVNPDLSANIAKAREMWGRLRRTEMIDTAVEKAKLQASGFENGIRIQIRQILNDPKKLRGFSADEIAAMREIVEGTAVGNLMKKIGKMGIGLSQQSNFLGAGLSGGAGAALGSPLGPAGAAIGAILPPAIGTLAQKGSERMTMNAATRARGLIASPPMQSVPQLPQQAVGLLEYLAQQAGRGGAVLSN